MIEAGRLPSVGIVARAALSRKVIGRLVFGVAGCTIGLAAVIKGRRLPGRRQVTIATLPRKVIGRFVRSVASHTIAEARMVEIGGLPD